MEGAPVGGPAGGRWRLGAAGAARTEARRAHGAASDRNVQLRQDAPAPAKLGPGDRVCRARDGHACRRGLEPVVSDRKCAPFGRSGNSR